MLITKTSLLTGITRTLDIPVTQEQMDLWLGGKVLIQNAMPNLDADDREFIMTGIIDSEWDSMCAAQEPEMDYWEYQESIRDHAHTEEY